MPDITLTLTLEELRLCKIAVVRAIECMGANEKDIEEHLFDLYIRLRQLGA